MLPTTMIGSSIAKTLQIYFSKSDILISGNNWISTLMEGIETAAGKWGEQSKIYLSNEWFKR